MKSSLIIFAISALFLITFTGCYDPAYDSGCGCYPGDPGYGQTTGGGDIDDNSWETSSVWLLCYYPNSNENIVLEDGVGGTLTVDCPSNSFDALQNAYNSVEGCLTVYVTCDEGYGDISGAYYSDCDISGF